MSFCAASLLLCFSTSAPVAVDVVGSLMMKRVTSSRSRRSSAESSSFG